MAGTKGAKIEKRRHDLTVVMAGLGPAISLGEAMG
jgi:hypothetical protein